MPEKEGTAEVAFYETGRCSGQTENICSAIRIIKGRGILYKAGN